MDIPHREPMRIRGFEFGNERGERSCAIIGSMRGNEVQQAFVCASLVSLLARIEQAGMIAANKCILIIPCVNPLSMNVQQRFWPGDNADINRSFPGDAHGRSTERIAAAVMRVARLFTYGMQLCSFNQPGDFLPHVRIADQGLISTESLRLVGDFGLPFALHRKPTPFDTTTLNYAWQESGTHAFSLYSSATDRIDAASSKVVTDAVLRFLRARKIVEPDGDMDVSAGHVTRVLREAELVDVRTERSSGFFAPAAHAGDRVRAGQRLGAVLDAMDARLLESLTAPVAGRVFFMRTDPLIQQHMVAFRIAPE
jgi:predicted deacylase